MGFVGKHHAVGAGKQLGSDGLAYPHLWRNEIIMRLFRNQSNYGQRPPLNKSLRCSFCGKDQDEVKKLIAGPAVYICNVCIDICNEIIADDKRAIELHSPQVHIDEGIEPGIRCSICQALAPMTEALLIPERGQLCPPCETAVRIAIDNWR